MFKQIIIALGALVAATAFAAVDVNKASQAELESVKGIGPTLSAQILGERQKAPFKDWSDLTTRVKGVGDASASKFSQNGLTVNAARALTGETAQSQAELVKQGLIEYIEFPQALVGKYQCFTEADLGRLRAVGCKHAFVDVAGGVAEYVAWLHGRA